MLYVHATYDFQLSMSDTYGSYNLIIFKKTEDTEDNKMKQKQHYQLKGECISCEKYFEHNTADKDDEFNKYLFCSEKCQNEYEKFLENENITLKGGDNH